MHINISLVHLTITMYMVMQGLAPSIWGPLSDMRGRRITYIGTFIVYLVSNLALGFTKNFTMLMVFRGLQAAGSAATISVGAGVIGDYTTPRERGGYIGTFGGSKCSFAAGRYNSFAFKSLQLRIAKFE
jgi:MFS family permease